MSIFTEKWLLLKHIFEFLPMYSSAITLDETSVARFSRMQHSYGATRLWRLITPAAATPSPTRVILKTWPDIKVPCLRFLSISFSHPSFLYDHIDFLQYSTLSPRHSVPFPPSPSPLCPLIYSPQTLFRKRVYPRSGIQTSTHRTSTRDFFLGVFLSTSKRRAESCAAAIYSRVIRDRVFESFASLIEFRQHYRHQKMNKLLASKFTNPGFLFSPQKLANIMNRVVSINTIGHNFYILNGKTNLILLANWI